MLIAIAVVFLGLALTIAALVAAGGRKAELARRLSLVAGKPGEKVTPVLERLAIQGGEIDDRLRKLFTVGMSHTWGMKAGSLALCAVAAGAATVAWGVSFRIFGLSLPLALATAGAVAFLLPRMILVRQQKRAERQFSEVFPDAVDTIVRMIRAGLPISQAIHNVGVEGQPPVNRVFAMMDEKTRIGIPIDKVLDASSRQVGLMEFRFFAVAVLLQHATGGNLAVTLEMLSSIVRKRRALRLKAQAATAEIRLTAYVLGALPFICVGALLVIQPDYLTPLFRDARGHVILAMAFGSLSAAFVTMWFMMRSLLKV
jgi:tight adherence protein B